MIFDHVPLWTCLFGLVFMGHGSYGVVKKRIATKGKFGPARTYTGREAVKEGIFTIVLGLIFVVFGLLNLL